MIAPRFSEIFEEYDLEPLAISVRQAQMAGLLAGMHRDPFDRILAAQAITEEMPLVTSDRELANFGAQVIW